MNNEIKVSLTVILPGSVMVSQPSKVEEIGFQLTKRDIYPTRVFKGSEGNTIVEEGTRRHIPKEVKEASQIINMTVDAYNSMVSRNECPHSIKKSIWQSMKETERLEYNLNRTCEHLGGISYSYVVFE